MSVRFTKHAHARANQRCFTMGDVEFIRMFGTEIPDDGNEVYLMRKKDIAVALGNLKREIQRLDKLAGCTAVLSGDNVITIYRAIGRAEKRLLRRQT